MLIWPIFGFISIKEMKKNIYIIIWMAKDVYWLIDSTWRRINW